MEEPKQPQANIANKALNNFQENLKQNYDSLGIVRITFRDEVGLPKLRTAQYKLHGHQKLWELKRLMSDLTKQNIYFYINQSFMPALDSRIGDLAQCYGRFDEGNKWYEMQLIVNSNEGRYG